MTRAAVTFEAVPPVLPDALPRMDVAAFVGFADAGPVDVPVAVEDLARFRDLFGGDPALAYDGATGQPHRGYLGATVGAFFASGGRRCWVVRVADDPGRARFAIPGLARLNAAPGPLSNQATLGCARAPGVWADELRAHATLRATPLRPAASGGEAALVISAPAPDGSGRRVTLAVAEAPGAITPGDTLRVSAPGSDLLLFLVAGEVGSRAGALLVTARDFVLARAAAGGDDDDDAFRSPALAVLDAGLLDDGPSSPWSSAALLADRLAFDLSVWRGDQEAGRMAGLAFSPGHPRFWGNLPDDVDLFWRGRRPRPDGRDDELATLWSQAAGDQARGDGAAGARFPLGGSDGGDPDAPVIGPAPGDAFTYLPSGMSTLAAPDRAGASAGASMPARRSGIESTPLAMFADERLRNQAGESLARSGQLLQGEARDTDRQAPARAAAGRPGGARPQRRLRGVHALLEIDEATLVAVPDAIHPGWSTEPPAPPALLAAPELTDARLEAASPAPNSAAAATAAAADELLLLEWTAVEGATSYAVEIAGRPDFAAVEAAQTVTGDDAGSGLRRARLPAPPPAAGNPLLHARIHALRDGAPSPWSATRRVVRRRGAFADCAVLDVDVTLDLSVAPPAPGAAAPSLRWTLAGGAPPAGSQFRVVRGNDPLFGAATSVATAGAAERAWPLPETADAPSYWRVRLESTDGAGPWSNTVAYVASSLTRPRLLAGGRGFDDTLLLSIHRVLLRLGHARGDLLALLSMPRHFGPAEVRDHLGTLMPDEGPGNRGGGAVARAGGAAVEQPLSLAELPALSYGALYFPWLAVGPGAAEAARFIPADGAAAGRLARTALGRGAWIASANRPLPAVLAVAPRLPDARLDELVDRQVNVIARVASGFVLLEDLTLSRDGDTRPISVRRLLGLLKRLALREGTALVFEPNDADLQERVLIDLERALSRLHLAGAFRGVAAEEAYRVVTGYTVNPGSGADAGRLVAELLVAPSRPLEFLRVRLVESGPSRLAVGEG